MALVVPLTLVFVALLVRPGDTTIVSEPLLSPDGRLVAFGVSFEAWPSPVGRGYVLNTENGRSWRLTGTEGGWVDWGGWSPQGRYLAYSITPGALHGAWLRLDGRDVVEDQGLGIFDAQTGKVRHVWHPAMHYGSGIRWREEGVIGVVSEEWRSGIEPFKPRSAVGQFRYEVATGAFERIGPVKESLVREEPPSDAAPEDWRLNDPNGRGFALVFRHSEAPGAVGGAFELIRPKDDIATEIGRIDEPIYKLYGFCIFSPGGRFLLYPARDGEGPLALWLLELATGDCRRLEPPGPLTAWLPQLTPDETRLVWSPAARYHPDSYGAREKYFYVHDLNSRASQPLKLAEGATGRWAATTPAALDNTFLYFVRGASLCRVRLDGTGLEELFPARRPLSR